MQVQVRIVFEPRSKCPPNIPNDIWERLDPCAFINIIPKNNLWEDTTSNLNPDSMKYKLYYDTYITDGVKQFMKIILREKNTIESPSIVTITKWIEV